tara:strand:+ start:1705 stop:2337 length:633 start_codon:yes stop_codon:yes gene_type:complete
VKLPKVIGLSGVARCGKDTFCKNAIDFLSRKGILSKREAFADQLKRDLDPFLLEKFGISAFTDSLDDKKTIRPIMVAYGKSQRDVSKGMRWIDQLKNNIAKNLENNIITFISDVRYPNEAKWIARDYEGITIHITRCENRPANEEEENNDPLVRALSSIKLEWPDFLGDETLATSYAKATLQQISRPLLDSVRLGVNKQYQKSHEGRFVL